MAFHCVGLRMEKQVPILSDKISVHELAVQLQSLGIYVYPTHDFSDHFNCNLVNRFRDQIASTLSSIPNPVLASHRRHMRIQARKYIEGGREWGKRRLW